MKKLKATPDPPDFNEYKYVLLTGIYSIMIKLLYYNALVYYKAPVLLYDAVYLDRYFDYHY